MHNTAQTTLISNGKIFHNFGNSRPPLQGGRIKSPGSERPPALSRATGTDAAPPIKIPTTTMRYTPGTLFIGGQGNFNGWSTNASLWCARTRESSRSTP